MKIRTETTRGARAITWLCGMVCFSCASGHEFSGPLPTPDGRLFVAEVYPALLRDCAFVTCHGAENRFFHLYGPGRTRFDVNVTEPDDPATLAEVMHSYDRSRSMLATSDTISTTLLLSKPLEPKSGGQGHQGLDGLGRNVFASVTDPGYQLLLKWANTSGALPTAADLAAANSALDEATSEVTP